MLTNRDIQILTHCDSRRVVRAVLLAQSVPADIDVICAVNGTNQDVVLRLGGQEVPANLLFIPSKHQDIYPANALRNRALEAASKEWVFYIDCDFVFCSDFWDVLRQRAADIGFDGEKSCYCPVALCGAEGQYVVLSHASNLIEAESDLDHTPPRHWAECGGAHLFKGHEMYFSRPFGIGRSPYEITGAMKRLRNIIPPEPWGILRRKHAVFADEDFRSGPMDKQQFVAALLDCGVRFFAVPDIFVFHLWHPESPENKYDRVRNECLWARRHRKASRTYLLVGLGGVLPSELLVRLRAVMSEPDASEATHTGYCAEQWWQAVPGEILLGPGSITRELFGRNSQILVFFSSPAYYREAYSRSDGDFGDVDACDYSRMFSESGNIHDAICSLENVSGLFDLNDPERCSLLFRNLTGVNVPCVWFQLDKNLTERARRREQEERTLYPSEYLLYDFARTWSGSAIAQWHGA